MSLGVGIMAGTSLDGVDAALVRLEPTAVQLLAFCTNPYPEEIRLVLESVLSGAGIAEVARLHALLGECFADTVNRVIEASDHEAAEIEFIASHGQTAWHDPPLTTLQLGSPSVIAERTGIPVVSDFRSADVAAGGEGAPLVPVADAMLFGHPDRPRMLLNIGGMANVTWVRRRGTLDGVMAFDTGPGVSVLDALARSIDPSTTCDVDGERAARGEPRSTIVDDLLADPYFVREPPKSTGREMFGRAFAHKLRKRVQTDGGTDNDALATACALTARTIADQIARWVPSPSGDVEVLVSGGGTHHPILMTMLDQALQPRVVSRFDGHFFDGDAKEAVTFAYLGWLSLQGTPGNVPSATGARGPRVLGSVTLAPGGNLRAI